MKIFYVGGLNNDIYYFRELLEVVEKKENVEFTICCRQAEWEKNKSVYEPYLNNNIKIIHKFGKELENYYNEADICSLFVKPTKYMSMAMPIKLFEYLSNGIPVIAIKNTTAGDFVKKNDCGWVIKYDKDELNKLLDDLIDNKKQIYDKAERMKYCIIENTWNDRAKQVEKDLLNYNIKEDHK